MMDLVLIYNELAQWIVLLIIMSVMLDRSERNGRKK
jgi:hypothetical protein